MPNVYEIHLTIDLKSKDEISLFKNICKTLKVKPILIELDSGEYANQCMTSSYIKSSYDEALKEVDDLSNALVLSGYKVLRSKIEARITNKDDIPLTDSDSKIKEYPNRYFEYHFKVRFKSIDKLTLLKDIAKIQEAHVSSNPLKRESDKGYCWFITKRIKNSSYAKASKESLFILNDIIDNFGNDSIDDIEVEYVMFDSNIDLDKGW